MENEESPIKQEPAKPEVKVTFISFPLDLKLKMKAKAKEMKITQQEYVLNLVKKDLQVV